MCFRCVRLLTVVTVVQPDPMAVVFTVTLHGVVGEVALRHLEVWIYNDLKGRGRRQISASHRATETEPASRSLSLSLSLSGLNTQY